MLSAEEKGKLELGFAEGAASVRLEGLEPGEPYLEIKARVLEAEITLDQGLDEIDAYRREKAAAAA
jgi:hypothetical protein